jgi:hypothetical protein
MTELNENRGRPGGSIKSLWTADEVRLVKHFINTFQIRQWDFPYTYVDRSDPEGEWILNVPRAAPKQGCISVRSTSITDGAEAEWELTYATNTDVLELTTDSGGIDVIAIKVAGVYHVDMALSGWVRIGLGGASGSTESVGFGIEDAAHDNVEGGSFGQRFVEKQTNPFGSERIEIDGSKSFDFLVAGTDEWHVHITNAGAGLGQIQWDMHLVQEYEAP